MTSIPYPYDINTTSVKINRKKLREVPEWIQLLTNLEELDLDSNRISSIPEWLGNMTNLKSLNLCKNTLSDLPLSLANLINIECIRLHDNHFRYVPQCISYMTRINHFGMANNMIETIPLFLFDNCTNIETLLIGSNYLTSIPSNIDRLTNLRELIFMKNDITTLPVSITRLNNLSTFYYNDNPYEHIPPQIERFIYRQKNNIDRLHIYSDSQSVHDSSIQRSISTSIENIMNQPFKHNITQNMDNIMYEIRNDPLIESKDVLEEYMLCEDVHSILQITFKELLCYVWETIKILEHQDEIKRILNIEIHDSKNMCFTGRISRLINCLNGFTNLVSITIDTSQEIGNIITISRHSLGKEYTIDKHKEIVKKELLERGYPSNTITEWLAYIE